MAAKTGTQLAARVLQLVGRTTNVSSTTLDLDAIVLDALNEAQRYIVRKLSHILELQVKDVTTWDATTDEYEYDLSDFEIPVAHIGGIWILDGTSSQKLKYVPKDEFDERWPDISEIDSGLPMYYTRRGNVLEFNCPISSDYNGKAIRVDYCKWCTDLVTGTSTQASELAGADYGLILFAWAETLRVLAKGNTTILAVANDKMAMFNEWLGSYRSYYDTQIEEDVE